MHSDPIADLLNRLKLAVKAQHEQLSVPASKLKLTILNILKKNHYIADFKTENNEILITLNPEIKTLDAKKVSKPGQRIYLKKTEIKAVKNGFGIAVYSTSRGMMTGREARKHQTGGELICEIY